jgi:D-3-phosphoglycerate dehydrogenase
MTPKSVLITDYVHPLLLTGLHASGYRTTYAPEMSREEMAVHLHNYSGVVINTRCAIDANMIRMAKSLKWIARLGSGLDIIDLEAAKEAGIQVYSAPEGNAQAVAEHAMGMLLCLKNKILPADRSVREGHWWREVHRGSEMEGSTIGIIGHGNNGSAFGRLWKGWKVRVLAYDKYLKNYGTDHVNETDLKTLLASSDVVSLHIPLTAETKEMVSADFLAQCKPGCILINTSRGKIVQLDALVDSLNNKHISGACLDVFPHEPPQKGDENFQQLFHKLCQMDNVVLTPHTAGWTIESKRKIAEVLLSKLGVRSKE